MDVRRLGPEDAALWRDVRLEALEREPEQFSSRYSDWADRPLADFAARLAGAPVWAAVEDGRALAVAALTPDPESAARGWIQAVYVRPEARGRGLARAVLAEVESEARVRGYTELRLEVRAANAAARGLYQRSGFREVQDMAGGCASRCEVAMAKDL